MNKVILSGRLTRDPEVRYTTGEKQMAVARFTLAVDRRKTRADEDPGADFIQCVMFDKLAQVAEKYYKQGTKLIAEGHIRTGSYTNKDGVKVYTTEAYIDNAEFAESKKEGQSAAPKEAAHAPEQNSDGWMSVPDGVDDEGLPFN